MNNGFVSKIASELEEIRSAGLFKTERIISSEQGAEIIVNGKTVLNFCANNYLGLSSHPKVLEAAKKYIDYRGYGMSSVRFICGTQDIHKELEQAIAKFLGTEDTRYYMLLPLMPIVFLNPCSMNRMPSSAMHSTMRRSLMGCDFARLSVTVMSTTIWPIWKEN